MQLCAAVGVGGGAFNYRCNTLAITQSHLFFFALNIAQIKLPKSNISNGMSDGSNDLLGKQQDEFPL